MAEEYISKDQFGEFVKRMEAGFHAQDQRFNAMNQRFTAVDQRFDAMNQRIDDLRQDMTGRLDSLDRRVGSLEGWIRATFVTVVVLGVGVVVQLVFLVFRLGLPKMPPTP